MSSVRFTVTKAEEDPVEKGNGDPTYGSTVNQGSPNKVGDSGGGDARTNKETDGLTDNEMYNVVEDKDMALYEEEFNRRPKISQIISNLANYEGGVEPNVGTLENQDKKPKRNKLGTLLGVYFPCIQNIFGVILFIRLVWVVGTAGWLEGFFIVLICCCTTLLTAISMSAIATNGVVPAGGSYFMISRSLGPEFGGAVGILFYLGTSVASSMYIVGAVEILLQYMAPAMSIFGDVTNPVNASNNYRVYGTILLLILFVWVYLGVKFVSKFATVALACVMFSILSIYIGIFVAKSGRGPTICKLGDRLLSSDSVNGNCQHGLGNNTIFLKYCGKSEVFINSTKYNVTDLNYENCSMIPQEIRGQLHEDCEFFCKNDMTEIWGIPGLPSGVIKDNLKNRYSKKEGYRIGENNPGDRSRGEIVADIATSFTVLLAIFFPSCTGIMAGSNRSGDLADASKSIPVGTIMAILTTSFVYLSCVIFFGSTIEGQLLRDKFGESIGGRLVVAELAWPNPWVILVGSLLSTVGAALQSLTGAPRLLQAIAADGVIPFLGKFAKTTKRGEPLLALLLTAFISEIGILVANLDYIAPIITMFFLMCYGFVNLACALQTILKTPSWRPRFRYYHWSLSLLGLALCIALMFISSWYFAIGAIALAAGVYKYIEFKGAEKEWGDGIRGLAMSAARYALHRLEEGPPHVKNWRPQLLLLVQVDDNLKPCHKRMLTFASQLKAGKGLSLISTVLEGKLDERFADAQAAKQEIMSALQTEKIKGFVDVIVARDVVEGLCHAIQASGIGGLRHNTIMLNWPYGWRHNPDEKAYRVFIETVRNVSACHHAILIPKGIDMFPESADRLQGNIDIWWIVHDGGLLMLLPFLLTQHRIWSKCKMRVFTVAQLEDNSLQMQKDIKKLLYHLRLQADVEVVEMATNDISAYTYERTLMMEQRNEMLRQMRLNKGKLNLQPEIIRDKSRKSSVAESKISIEPFPDKEEEELSVSDLNQFTYSPPKDKSSKTSNSDNLMSIKPTSKKSELSPPTLTVPMTEYKGKLDQRNVRRMHTAVKLNETIVNKSHDSQLVIMNLPGLPKNARGEENYMEFLEVLTEGLNRVLLVRGGGREVITIYS